MTMPVTTLGRTELAVGRLGFGGSPIGHLETPQRQVGRVLDLLTEAGGNLIDTAACYGSEPVIGKHLAGRRDEVVLVTKAGYEPESAAHVFTPEGVTASLDRSLQALRTDHVDVVLLHSCDLKTLREGSALDALVEAQQAGKTRFVGYSGDNDAAAFAAADPRVAVLEMSVNLCDQHNLEHVLPIAREHDCGVLAKRPLANAAWKAVDEQQGRYQDYVAEYTRRFGLMDVTPAELGYSGHVDVEWPEVALKFTLAQAGVHVALAGTTSRVHMEMNLEAAEKNPLREQATHRLQEAFKTARDADGGDWPALR